MPVFRTSICPKCKQRKPLTGSKQFQGKLIACAECKNGTKA